MSAKNCRRTFKSLSNLAIKQDESQCQRRGTYGETKPGFWPRCLKGWVLRPEALTSVKTYPQQSAEARTAKLLNQN